MDRGIGLDVDNISDMVGLQVGSKGSSSGLLEAYDARRVRRSSRAAGMKVNVPFLNMSLVRAL